MINLISNWASICKVCCILLFGGGALNGNSSSSALSFSKWGIQPKRGMSYLVNDVFLFLCHTVLGAVKHSKTPNLGYMWSRQMLIDGELSEIDGELFWVLTMPIQWGICLMVLACSLKSAQFTQTSFGFFQRGMSLLIHKKDFSNCNYSWHWLTPERPGIFSSRKL